LRQALLSATKWTFLVAVFPVAAIVKHASLDLILGVTLLSVCLCWIGAVCEIRGRTSE